MQRQRDSVAIVVCSGCYVQNWADQEAVNATKAGKVFPLCPKCGVACEIGTIPPGTPEPLTVDDLDRVSLPDAGVSARQATHQEFDVWARTFVNLVETGDILWDPQQRADFCDFLYLQGKIEVLPRMVEEAACNKGN